MTSAYQSEYILRAVQDVLRERLPDKLAEIEQRWLDIEPVPLLAPRSFEFGFRDPAVDRPMTDFPIISLVGAPRTNEQTGATSSRIADATHELYVAWVIVGSSQRAAQLTMWRYGEAVLEVLLKGSYAGFSPLTKVPRTDEGMATPFYASRDDSRPAGWMAGASAMVPMRGTYVL